MGGGGVEGIDEDRNMQTGEKVRQRDGDVKIESGQKMEKFSWAKDGEIAQPIRS